MKIKVPKSKEKSSQELDLSETSNLVIVGENGAGKSRFGSYVERNLSNVRRISAQRMLSLINNPPMVGLTPTL